MSTLVNFLFLNVGHFFAHLMMLIYPVLAIVAALSAIILPGGRRETVP
tara:strand:+ start:492 stop:635 length:144 start_codon:yes stop_codon:yes gene_type:complete